MKQGVPGHPKTASLRAHLECRLVEAVGYLNLLWEFACQYAPQGDVGRWPDEAIEAACDWPGVRGELVASLVASGWLDESEEHRLVVHDWADHRPDYIRKRLQRAGERSSARTADNGGQRPPNGGQRRTTAARVGLGWVGEGGQGKEETEPPPSAPAVSSPPAEPAGTNGTKHPKAAGPRQCLMPKAFEPADWQRLQRLTSRHDLNEDQLGYACRTVYAWSHGGGKMRRDWVLTVHECCPCRVGDEGVPVTGFDEDSKPAGPTAKATRAPVERKYPVAPHEARDTAVRRILHRDDRRSAPNPSEWQVWLEFHEFPEVLGPYQGPPGEDAKRWDRHYGEHWITVQEREDRRIYGDVRDSTSQRIEDLLLRIGGEDPLAKREQIALTLPQRLAAWDACIPRAVAEGCSEESKRLRFLRRGRKRLAERGLDADALAMVFD